VLLPVGVLVVLCFVIDVGGAIVVGVNVVVAVGGIDDVYGDGGATVVVIGDVGGCGCGDNVGVVNAGCCV